MGIWSARIVVLNRLDEARATAQEAQAHNLDAPFIHASLYQVDFLQHDAAGMEREAAGLMGKPGYEDVMLYLESDTAGIWRGVCQGAGTDAPSGRFRATSG